MLKHTKIIVPVLLMVLLLVGCGEKSRESPALPEGFTLDNQIDSNSAILKDETMVGAILRTNLGADTYIHAGEEKDEIVEYLKSYIEPPLEMEYMMGSGLGNVQVEISLIAYNVETQTAHEFKHYLFQQEDSVLYDLWLDTELVNPDEIDRILDASGLVPSQN